MVGDHERSEREKLSKQRIGPRSRPVDSAQDVWADGVVSSSVKHTSCSIPGRHLRDADGHGSGRDTVEDILDELFAGLCARAAVVEGHMLWQHGIQKLGEF